MQRASTQWLAGRMRFSFQCEVKTERKTLKKLKGVEVFRMSKVLCLFCFQISSLEGRGGEKGGRANFKTRSGPNRPAAAIGGIDFFNWGISVISVITDLFAA